MISIREHVRRNPWLGWVLFFATVVIVFLLGLLASSIMERRAEAVFSYQPEVEHNQWEPRNEIWGENFPREYDTWKNTKDTTLRTSHNGNAFIDMLERDPRLVILWADYGFSKEYAQSRGHYYSIEDMRNNLRTGAPVDGQSSPMPNTCWTCKSPDVPRLMSEIGPQKFYSGSWEEKGHEIVNPIGCADCHEAKTMNLQVSRPALEEAYQRTDKSVEDASHQKMRQLVCAQCHSEYYFKGEDNYLVFPWDKGLGVEDAEEYYDEMEFTDWTHGISKAPMLKAQHPDYELFTEGIHAQRGLACADCHMPYTSEGGQKFTDHKIVSPLDYLDKTCAVCHRESETELTNNINERFDKVKEAQYKLEDQLVQAHFEAKKAWDLGATEEQMEDALLDIRHAQWRWGFVANSHGAPFHAPIESLNIFSSGLDIVQNARLKLSRILADLGYNKEVEIPDISTKAKAQEVVGLNMDKLNEQKEKFLDEVVPEWDKKAREREKTYEVKELNP
ncbi:MAG: ammonia-forming cytochrome c nitrite reductase [Bacteroidales bacterium]